jgi:hypothetical protein
MITAHRLRAGAEVRPLSTLTRGQGADGLHTEFRTAPPASACAATSRHRRHPSIATFAREASGPRCRSLHRLTSTAVTGREPATSPATQARRRDQDEQQPAERAECRARDEPG